MLAPHRITYPGVSWNGNTGILTQLADTRELFMLLTYSILKSVQLCSNSSYAWIFDHINPPPIPPPPGSFPDESAGVYQMWCQLVHPFGSYSRFLNFRPPKTPQNAPWGKEGLIVFSLCPFPDESAGVYQMLCQLVHSFGSYSRFFNFWPPKTPQNSPWGIEGLIVFSLCTFPDESAGMYQIWCQLIHPFGSYSRFVNIWPPKTPQTPLG